HHRHPLSVSSWTKHRPCIRLATNPSWLRRVRDLPVRSVPMSCFSSGLDTSRPRLINVSRTARSGSENSVPDMVDPFLSSGGEKLFQLPQHDRQLLRDLAVGEPQ